MAPQFPPTRPATRHRAGRDLALADVCALSSRAGRAATQALVSGGEPSGLLLADWFESLLAARPGGDGRPFFDSRLQVSGRLIPGRVSLEPGPGIGDDGAEVSLGRQPPEFAPDALTGGDPPVLVVPDAQTEKRVRDAVDFARDHAGNYGRLDTLVSRLPAGRPFVKSANVGQAIAVVQFWHFAWPEQNGSHFQDFESARLTHYAVEGQPGGNPLVHNDYNSTNTEFYLLPELSAAAQIEAAAKLQEPLPALLVQRLYGSAPEDGDVPTLIDLFYLARQLKMLQSTTRPAQQSSVQPPAAPPPQAGVDDSDGSLYDQGRATGRAVAGTTRSMDPPTVSWYLLPGKPLGRPPDPAQLSRTAFPLVQYAQIGAPPIGDPLGAAREQFILLDAFIAAMGFRGGLNPRDDLPVFDGPRRGTMLGTTWGDDVVRGRLENARQYLLEHWWDLGASGHIQSSGSDGRHQTSEMLTPAADGAATYRRMMALADADAALLPAPLAAHWQRICRVIFGHSLMNLHHDSQALM